MGPFRGVQQIGFSTSIERKKDTQKKMSELDRVVVTVEVALLVMVRYLLRLRPASLKSL